MGFKGLIRSSGLYMSDDISVPLDSATLPQVARLSGWGWPPLLIVLLAECLGEWMYPQSLDLPRPLCSPDTPYCVPWLTGAAPVSHLWALTFTDTQSNLLSPLYLTTSPAFPFNCLSCASLAITPSIHLNLEIIMQKRPAHLLMWRWDIHKHTFTFTEDKSNLTPAQHISDFKWRIIGHRMHLGVIYFQWYCITSQFVQRKCVSVTDSEVKISTRWLKYYLQIIGYLRNSKTFHAIKYLACRLWWVLAIL